MDRGEDRRAKRAGAGGVAQRRGEEGILSDADRDTSAGRRVRAGRELRRGPMIIYLSLLVCVAGLLIFALTTTNQKVIKIGEIMFWTGLLAFLLEAVPRMVG